MKLAPQVFVSHTRPEPEKIEPIMNEKFWKPVGGLWTSTLDEEGGEWVRWLNGENYSLEDPRWGGKLWLLRPTEVNLAVVNNPYDLRDLVREYPVDLPAEFERIRSFRCMVDWEALAKDYDGLHVPDPWPWRLHLDEYDMSMFFYVMDAECTCWFRWCFEGEPVELDPHTPYLAAL